VVAVDRGAVVTASTVPSPSKSQLNVNAAGIGPPLPFTATENPIAAPAA
jgi:hypothetical protein